MTKTWWFELHKQFTSFLPPAQAKCCPHRDFQLFFSDSAWHIWLGRRADGAAANSHTLIWAPCFQSTRNALICCGWLKFMLHCLLYFYHLMAFTGKSRLFFSGNGNWKWFFFRGMKFLRIFLKLIIFFAWSFSSNI